MATGLPGAHCVDKTPGHIDDETPDEIVSGSRPLGAFTDDTVPIGNAGFAGYFRHIFNRLRYATHIVDNVKHKKHRGTAEQQKHQRIRDNHPSGT